MTTTAMNKKAEILSALTVIACKPEPSAKMWTEVYAKQLARHRERRLHAEQYQSELDEVELVCTGRNVAAISKQQYKKLIAEKKAFPSFKGEYVSILSGRHSNGDHEYFVYFSPTNAL